MRADGQCRDVRLSPAVMLSAIAQGNRRQQGQESQPTAVVCLPAGRPAPGVGYISKRERERERERERDLGGELRMADHSVLYFFFFVKRFYPFVNTPPHLELFPAPRRIRPPYPPDVPLTAKYPRLRASPRLRWLFFGVACPSSASARQENFFSRASNALKEKTGCRFVHAKGIPLSMIL